MRCSTIILSCLLLTISVAGFADRGEGRSGQNAAPVKGYDSRLTEAPRTSRISSQRAASLVKQRYSGSRVLGVTAIADEGVTLYKVRTLSNDGVVKSVFVDGNSGAVFE